MKRLLLLGGFGFIGTNILKYIDKYLRNEYSIIVFDKFESHNDNIRFECIECTYAGDFSDNLLLEKVFRQHKIDMVIHLISTTVPISSGNARADIESNLFPTIVLLDLLVKYGVLDITFISSGGAVYGESNNVQKHKETDNLYPKSSYGVVKLSIEKYLFQYSFLYHLRPLVLRLSNPYGKYHYSDKQGVCNIALNAAIKNKEFQVWGNGNSKKDYIFIDDFCNILFKLYSRKVHTSVLNVGSGYVYSVNEILTKIKDYMPYFEWEYTNESKLDVSHFELDTTNLHLLIKDFKFTSINDGIFNTLKWIKEKY